MKSEKLPGKMAAQKKLEIQSQKLPGKMAS